MRKRIEIACQPRLGFLRTLRITLDGIRYRLFRASVTVAVIAVAVAFLMNILSESLNKRAVAYDTRERIEAMQLVHVWASRLVKPGSIEDVITDVAKSKETDPLYEETASLGGLSPEEMRVLHREARSATAYLSFFDDLNYGQRRRLVHTSTGAGIFNRLLSTERFSEFENTLGKMHSIRLNTSFDEFQAFLSRWPETRKIVERIIEGRSKAVERVAQVLGPRPIIDALTGADGEFGESVRRAGFRFDAKTIAPTVAKQARLLVDTGRFEQSIQDRLPRQVVAQVNDVLPTDVTVTMMWKTLSNPKDAEWYLSKMKEAGIDTSGMDAEYLMRLNDYRKESEALTRAEKLTADVGVGWMGLGRRMGLLVVVSMLVCGIGISNAMLMTVTERFREIATMKCLGALDGFIMIVFVLEACFLGLFGGIIGGVLGDGIGISRTVASFGPICLNSIPVLELFIATVISIALGIVLAAIAAVYPSFKAARLAPMEAMRIE